MKMTRRSPDERLCPLSRFSQLSPEERFRIAADCLRRFVWTLIANLAIRRADPDITGQRQLQSAAKTVSMHSDDHDFFHLFEYAQGLFPAFELAHIDLIGGKFF